MNLKKTMLPVLLFMALVSGGCKKELDPTEKGLLVPPTVDEDAALPYLDANGTRLHSETFGHPDSALVIMLHGGPGGDYRYPLKAKALANDGYFVVFYDQRGSGLSRRHAKSEYSIQMMLDDLTAVIDHYRKTPAQKVFLLGHSWGGMLATAYINRYPERINGAILAEPGGFTWKITSEYLSRSRPSNPTSELFNDATYLDQFLTGKATEHEMLDYKFSVMVGADFAKDNIIGNGVRIPEWRSGAVVSDALMDIAGRDGFDWTNNLHTYTVPVLFVYSERNKAYGLEHAKNVSAPYPHVQLVQTPNSGHDMVYEAWDLFYPDALTYLNSLK